MLREMYVRTVVSLVLVLMKMLRDIVTKGEFPKYIATCVNDFNQVYVDYINRMYSSDAQIAASFLWELMERLSERHDLYENDYTDSVMNIKFALRRTVTAIDIVINGSVHNEDCAQYNAAVIEICGVLEWAQENADLKA